MDRTSRIVGVALLGTVMMSGAPQVLADEPAGLLVAIPETGETVNLGTYAISEATAEPFVFEFRNEGDLVLWMEISHAGPDASLFSLASPTGLAPIAMSPDDVLFVTAAFLGAGEVGSYQTQMFVDADTGQTMTYNLTATVIPEPSSALLLLTAGAFAAVRRAGRVT